MKQRWCRALIAAFLGVLTSAAACALDSVSAQAPRSLVILQNNATVSARWTTMLQQGIDVKDSAATVVTAGGIPTFPLASINPANDRKAVLDQLEVHVRANAPTYATSIAAILLANSVSVGTAEIVQTYTHPLHGAKMIVWNLMIFSSGKYSYNSPTLRDAGTADARKMLQAIYVPLLTGGRVPAEYRWDVFNAAVQFNPGTNGNPSLPGGVLYWRLVKWDQTWSAPWSMVDLQGQFDEEYTDNGTMETTLMSNCLIDNRYVSPTGRSCPARNVPVSIAPTTWAAGISTPSISSFKDLRTFQAQIDATNTVLDYWHRMKPSFYASARGGTAQDAKVWINVTSRTLKYVCVVPGYTVALAPGNNYTETGTYRYVFDRTISKFMFDGDPDSYGLVNYSSEEIDTNLLGALPYSKSVNVTAADVAGIQANSSVLTHMAIWRAASRFPTGTLSFGPAVVKNIPPCTAPASCTPITECSDECAPPSTANTGIAWRRTYCADFATPTWGGWNQMTGQRSCFTGSTRTYYNATCTLNTATCGGTQTATEACPGGEAGIITNTRTQICPSGEWGPWTQLSSTCGGVCTPASESRVIACPDGFTGTRGQNRQRTCPANTWSAWADTEGQFLCTPLRDVCPNLPGAQQEVPSGMFRQLVNGEYVCQPYAVLGYLCTCGEGQSYSLSNNGLRRTVNWTCNDPGIGRVNSVAIFDRGTKEFISTTSTPVPGFPPVAQCAWQSLTTWESLLQ